MAPEVKGSFVEKLFLISHVLKNYPKQEEAPEIVQILFDC